MGSRQPARRSRLDWYHIAVDHVLVPALVGRYGIQVFQIPDIVGAHPAVLPGDCVSFHPAFVVAAHQSVDIELHIKTPLFLFGEKGAVHSLFYAHEPGADRMHGKIDRLIRCSANSRKLECYRNIQ